ncbi:MAG TPA: hypothetical protein PLV92_21915, partial [Pirellulaceae bacterium]|nr:hypothetical protein [Pirellulaceae bacterium]
GAATLNLSFLASGSSGIGLQRLPRVELKDGRPMKHWFAYSASTTLEAARPVGLMPLDIANFVEAWGETSDLPLAAFRLTPSSSDASVGTRYREPRTQGVEATDIGIALGRGRIDYRADLETVEGQLFQLRVEVPADLEVQNVTVIPRDRTDDHVRHWALVGRTLHVQFERPLSGAYRLLVSAEFPVRTGEAQAAPELRLSTAIQIQNRTTRIFRRPGVQVRAAGVPDTMPTGLERGEYVEPWGRLVAAWDDRGAGGGAGTTPGVVAGGSSGTTAGGAAGATATPVTLLAESDPVRGQALVRTALLPRRDGGLLSIQGAVQLETGALDELRFEVPQDWEAPTESSPRGVWTRRPLPTADRQLLILRLQRPLAGTFTFEFRGPNINVYEGRSAAPDVQLLDVPTVERFCGLPTRARDRRVEWETRGLVAAPLPESGRVLPPLPPLSAGDPRPASELMSWYRVTGSQFRAVIQEIQGASVEPRVRLADHELFLDSAGRIVVVSTLDLEPAGRADAELTLPEEGRLVQ